MASLHKTRTIPVLIDGAVVPLSIARMTILDAEAYRSRLRELSDAGRPERPEDVAFVFFPHCHRPGLLLPYYRSRPALPDDFQDKKFAAFFQA